MAMKEDIQKSDEEIQPAGERRQARFVLFSRQVLHRSSTRTPPHSPT
jgi:hypothetical protein